MELESKFIEGTNNQYSIRNDGEVISNRKNILLVKSKNYVCLGANKKVCISVLLKQYFGFKFCTKCNKKITDLNRVKCKECSCYGLYRTQRNREYQNLKLKAWKENNNEDYKNLTLLHSKANCETLSRSYIAHNLHMPVKFLTEELYQLEKAKILLIRLIKSKKKCQIQQ